MRPASLRLTLPVAAAMLVAACTGSSDTSDSGRSQPPAATSTTAATPAGPTVTDAGGQPRTELRLRLTEGTAVRVSYTTDLAITQAAGETTSAIDPPPVAQTIEYRVGRVDDEGAEVTFTVTEVDVAEAGTDATPAEVLLLQDALKDLVGITGTGRLSLRGHLDRITFDLPVGLSDAVRNQVAALEGQLGSLIPTLPEEPVGVGATWTATDTGRIGGLDAEQTTMYVLTAVDGRTVSYTSRTSYRAPAQDLPADNLPAGTTARLVSSELAGTASGTFELDDPGHTLTATASGTQVVDIQRGEEPAVRSTQRVEVATRVRALP